MLSPSLVSGVDGKAAEAPQRATRADHFDRSKANLDLRALLMRRHRRGCGRFLLFRSIGAHSGSYADSPQCKRVNSSFRLSSPLGFRCR
jgi:hypothetical protein